MNKGLIWFIVFVGFFISDAYILILLKEWYSELGWTILVIMWATGMLTGIALCISIYYQDELKKLVKG